MMTLELSGKIGPGPTKKNFKSKYGFRITGDVLYERCAPGGPAPEPIAFYEADGPLGCWRMRDSVIRYRDLTLKGS